MKIVEKTITDRKGRTFEMRGPEDGVFASFKEMMDKQMKGDISEIMTDIVNLEMREDDIFIATYPKTGTHWINEIVYMVMKEAAEYDTNPKEQSMLEWQTPESLASLPSPRVLNGHMLPYHLPKQVVPKKVKVIHVMRNPKDVAVSFFNFSKNLPLILPAMDNKPFETFSEFLPYFTGEYGVFWPMSIFEYYNEMEKFIQDHPGQILHLCFEDMKKNPVEAVEQVAKFLNKYLSKELMADIAEKCSFKNLKKADDKLKEDIKFSTVKVPFKIETPQMYRKGEVGDWKNHFTVAENEQFDKLLNEHFKDNSWKFCYSI